MNAPNPEFIFYSGRTCKVAQVRVQVVQETCAVANSLCNKPEDSALFFNEVVARSPWFDTEKECVVIILLDVQYRIKGWSLVSLGTQNSCLLHSREVLRAALVGGAYAFVLMHNHPSGDPTPSSSDLKVTREVRGAGAAVDIQMLDHVVVGRPACDPTGLGFYSFRTAGIC